MIDLLEVKIPYQNLVRIRLIQPLETSVLLWVDAVTQLWGAFYILQAFKQKP